MQCVAERPIVEYQSLVLTSFLRLSIGAPNQLFAKNGAYVVMCLQVLRKFMLENALSAIFYPLFKTTGREPLLTTLYFGHTLFCKVSPVHSCLNLAVYSRIGRKNLLENFL